MMPALSSTAVPSFPFWLLCQALWYCLTGKPPMTVQLHPPHKITF